MTTAWQAIRHDVSWGHFYSCKSGGNLLHNPERYQYLPNPSGAPICVAVCPSRTTRAVGVIGGPTCMPHPAAAMGQAEMSIENKATIFIAAAAVSLLGSVLLLEWLTKKGY